MIFDPLDVEPKDYVATYRGELNLVSKIQWEDDKDSAWVTVLPDLVDEELGDFLSEYESRIAGARAARGQLPPGLDIESRVRVLAWTYAEWLRIHPFADGNGRTGVCLIDRACVELDVPPFLLLTGSLHFGSLNFCAAVRRACTRSVSTDDASRYEDLVEIFASELEQLYTDGGHPTAP